MTGADILAAIERVRDATARAQAELDALDAVSGDGDHGVTMVLGWRAAVAALLEPPKDAGDALRVAAEAFADVGGSAGPLWGTGLLWAGRALARDDSIAVAAQAAVEGMCERGRCIEGDRTVVDAMAPAARALTAGHGLQAAAEAATLGAAATVRMVPRRGRAAHFPDRAKGHIDAGAQAAAVFWNAVSRCV